MKAIYILIIVFFGFKGFSQGGSDLKYIPIEEVNASFTGKEIRVDFRSSPADVIVREINIRQLLSKTDVANLEINGEVIQFKEAWMLTDDMAYLSSQVLENINKEGTRKTEIHEMFLENIGDSLTIKINMYYFSKKRNSRDFKDDFYQKKTETIC